MAAYGRNHTGCKCLTLSHAWRLHLVRVKNEPEAFVYNTCASSIAQSHLDGTTSKRLREQAKFVFNIHHSVSLACSYL